MSSSLAALVKAGQLRFITGEDLFALFRRLGIPVRLETKIVFEKHGKVKSLAEKFREGG